MIYLDHAANSPVLPEVLDAMLPWFKEDRVGNPSSIHTQGVRARHAVEKAREQVANMIGADPSEIHFTSDGTESNNMCLGFAGSQIITTKVEHESVLEPCRRIKTVFAKVHKDGSVDLDDLESVLTGSSLRGAKPSKQMVSMMWVNNELGTINPIKDISALCRKYDAIFHSDAVQAVGHVKVNVKDFGVDCCSISGHKFGAPLGIGAVYIRKGLHAEPFVYGGGQERGMRGGTENVPGIVGMGKAAEIVTKNLQLWQDGWFHLRKLFLTRLSELLPDAFEVNGSQTSLSPNIISLTIPGINSETLLLMLDHSEICLSAGSACSAGKASSHVLKAIGMPNADAASTVRISMGYDTTASDMIKAASAIAQTVTKIKSLFLIEDL